jgi:hypothetical protein
MFTFGLRSPPGHQLVREGNASLHLLADMALGSLKTLFPRGDPQFVIFDS